MAVFAEDALGTVGGGHIELMAQQQARRHLAADLPPMLQRYALGPSLGQCCGGQVTLRFEKVGAADVAALRLRLAPVRSSVALFGGGHVGHALVRVLRELPLQLHWIDSRDEIFPADMPAHVLCEHSDPVQAAVPGLHADSCVLIMSFSHAEDLEVLAACLTRHRLQADLPYLGLIGSRSKWASFRHRLLERGFSEQELSHVTCPIGVPGILGKQPEVIAVAVAAQLLQILSHRSARCTPT
jgi:xanthine dehydrogenase accessory factor